MDNILNEASSLAAEEFKNFLSKHVPAEKRYLAAIKAIASGENTWSAIKEFMENQEKRTIQDGTISRILNGLLDSSFIEKIIEGRNIHYEIADPVVKHAVLRLKIS